ncbi:MAG: HIT domain-containing protein [Steroidobacteraceae bacterium]|nr:HIT domain-containing protein [Steroidobacteraceae bacterium]
MKANDTDVETAIHTLVAAARDGREPAVVARLSSGWALFGRQQFVRGYCLLLPDPVVPQLNDLSAEARSQYLQDMTRLGDAVLRATGAVRINYAILGNQEPALHAHVIPRFADEVPELRTQHPWAYDWAAAPVFDPAACEELGEAIRRELARMGVSRPMRYAPGERLGQPVS